VLQEEASSCTDTVSTTHSPCGKLSQRRTTGSGWWQGTSKGLPAQQAVKAAEKTAGDDGELSRLLQLMDQVWIKRTA
jgi:hypothetical protein